MQLENYFADGKYFDCSIPDSDDELMPEVKWGDASRILTPAFWRFHYVTDATIRRRLNYRLGNSLLEEVVACLLGGHGIVGEVGIAAFTRLRERGLIDEKMPNAENIESTLREPLNINGRPIRYRFPTQKARYITAAIRFLRENKIPSVSGVDLRNWLTEIPGIGFKTSAWIVRNWSDSDEVAILDIHIHRAGVIAGFFSPNDDVSRDYCAMEKRFLQFASGLGVPAGILDNQIWNQMRIVPSHVRSLLICKGVKQSDKCGLPTANHRSAARNYELFAEAQ